MASTAVELPLASPADVVTATTAILDGLDRPAMLVVHSCGAVQSSPWRGRTRTWPTWCTWPRSRSASRSGAPCPSATSADEAGCRVALLRRRRRGEPRPRASRRPLYADADPEAAAEAVARLRPVHHSVLRGTAAVIAWRRQPSTYVVCTDERAVHPDLQRAMAELAATRMEWPGGHYPALVRPAEVADLIARLAARG